MRQSSQVSHDQLRRAVRQHLETLRRAGVRYVSQSVVSPVDSSAADQSLGDSTDSNVDSGPPSTPTEREMNRTSRSKSTSVAPAETPQAAEPPINKATAGLSRKKRVAELEILRAEVSGCPRCQELVDTRTQTVFGVGNPQARLVFCGEAPGADEDKQGEPFVGRAGQLLTKIIEACTLSREEVYILNVLKCRPPGNRNPLPTEVHNCRGYLDRQLEIIRPEYICCLGTVAAQTLLETTTPIGRLRGSFHDYKGIPVWCTYHPAYLLRNPGAKRHVWDDMKALMSTMGIDVEGGGK